MFLFKLNSSFRSWLRSKFRKTTIVVSKKSKGRAGITEQAKSLKKSATTILGLTFIGLSLAACVTSDTSLLADTKPLLGQHFGMASIGISIQVKAMGLNR